MTAATGIGRRLRELRRECDLTQQQLADKTGLPVWLIAKLELGQRSLQPQAAAALAAVLGEPLDPRGRATTTRADPPPRPETRGLLVRKMRRRRGLTLEAAAGLIGKSNGWLSLVENGRLELDKLSDITALAAVLGVPVADLAGVPVCQGCARTLR